MPPGPGPTSMTVAPSRGPAARAIRRLVTPTAAEAILPMYLDGTYEAMPKGTTIIKNRNIGARIGRLGQQRLGHRARDARRFHRHSSKSWIARQRRGILLRERDVAIDVFGDVDEHEPGPGAARDRRGQRQRFFAGRRSVEGHHHPAHGAGTDPIRRNHVFT